VVGSLILLVACFMPMLLFRLLAFVDPGTASGASFRSTMNANGGVAGLLRGKGGQAGGAAAGSGAASETAPDGRTTAEGSAEAETATRWQSSTIGKAAGVVASGMDRTGKVAQAGAGMGVDVLGQSGIGNQGYYDTSHSPKQAGQKQHHKRQPINDTNKDGVANDIPPEAQTAVEDGGFIA